MKVTKVIHKLEGREPICCHFHFIRGSMVSERKESFKEYKEKYLENFLLAIFLVKWYLLEVRETL